MARRDVLHSKAEYIAADLSIAQKLFQCRQAGCIHCQPNFSCLGICYELLDRNHWLSFCIDSEGDDEPHNRFYAQFFKRIEDGIIFCSQSFGLGSEVAER